VRVTVSPAVIGTSVGANKSRLSGAPETVTLYEPPKSALRPYWDMAFLSTVSNAISSSETSVAAVAAPGAVSSARLQEISKGMRIRFFLFEADRNFKGPF
jgi:hypothetical protein